MSRPSSLSLRNRQRSLRIGSNAAIRRSLALTVLIVLSAIQPTTGGSGWSSYFSSSGDKTENEKSATLLVSPIVNREIQVSVKAPWPSTSEHSVLCEAFCFLRDYRFLDALAVFQGRDHLVTYERATQYALELAEQSGIVQDSSLLKVALTMRAMAPTCELHRSIVQDRYAPYAEYLEAFAVVAQGDGGETILETSSDIPTSIVDLPVLTRQERKMWLLPNEAIRKGDRTIVGNEKDVDGGENDNDNDQTCGSTGLVILYARLGGHSFATFYRRLVELEIPFVVRHMGGDPQQDKEQPETVLQGYGVRLDIRNVEYKVFDDKKDVDESTQAAMIKLASLDGNITDNNSNITNPLSSHFLAGVNLTALSLDGEETTVYDLQRQLWTLHERYEAQSGLIPPKWQRRKLSLQAATVIAHSVDPLFTLQDVSQNLPSVASTLVHTKVSEAIEKVAESMEQSLQRMIRSSGGGLWINGRIMYVERPSFNVFEMIKLLQEEYNEMARMERELKPFLKADSSMAGLEAIQEAWIRGSISKESNDGDEEEMPYEDEEDTGASVGGKGQYRIDLATGDEGSVIYMNDLEKDKGYARLPSSVQQMLMALQYGMPPSVRRNLFTILVVDDPIGEEESAQNLGDSLIGQLAQQQYPARLAVVVAGKDDIDACSKWIRSGKATSQDDCPLDRTSWLNRDEPPGEEELKSIEATPRDFHRLYAYMRQKFMERSEVLIAYKLYLGPSLKQKPPTNGEFYSLFDLFTMHNELLVGLQITMSNTPTLEIARSLQQEENDSKQSYAKSVRFAVDKGLKPGMSFLNGRPLPTDADDAEKIQTVFSEEQQLIFGMVIEQKLTDTTPRNFYYKLIKGKKKNVFPRLHPLLTTSSSDNFVEILHGFGDESLLKPRSMVQAPVLEVDNALFLFEAFLEFDTAEGLTYIKDFLKMMDSLSKSTDGAVVGVRYRVLPSTTKSAKSPLCVVLSRAAEYDFDKLLEIVDNLANDPEANIDIDLTMIEDSLCSDVSFTENELPSRNFITANGRVYNMNGEPLDPVDIELLTHINMDSTKFTTALLRSYIDDTQAFDAVSRTTAFLMAAKNASKKRSDPGDLLRNLEEHYEINENPLKFSWNTDGGSNSGLKMKVSAIVDPATETAQRLSPLLGVIRDELNLPLALVISPTTHSDGDSGVPISSYYRFVADPSSYQGGESSPHAHFSNLPTGHVLTLRMDVPEPWDVQQTSSIQDTDNLRCDLQAGCGDEDQRGDDILNQHHVTNVEYGLEHLLFFGQCYDTRLSPPNGLQLVLSKPEISRQQNAGGAKTAEIEADGSVNLVHSNGNPTGLVPFDTHYSDTLVMKTVGYWQLRANPGVWNLQINEKSRGAEIFQMVDGKVKHGMLRVYGNIDDNKKRLVMGDFASDGRGEMLLVKRKPGFEKSSLFYDDKRNTEDDDVVHVFSLATGHLYERFLKIMMLSVTKRTSTKVKFWLFENFLSPTFKASSLAMAKRIGCEVEFVTYKWPEWLRGQSEKQRIIWGYKILFLDVLFPLSVKKIIYVDSDQVVRGDLKELWDMDLKGAPYGYTPMCSSNEATLGFQFWRQGFWESHLRGKPYHISALYVVDLEKFRKDRVGDTLRSQYQALSADPASLANLDQDLPNYAQHQVPIFSLPQEWLWCESWCSNETKANAKTIDLCNNPLHKEPKVSMAKRIISGELFQESWIELDAEVEKYEKEYLAELSASKL
ncbi:glycosyl transferase family protein [Nitzschia inconspicua]|uniref:Glycosyl transferase family protein n=1 Tax=Nitzschia inconspicua TaxID=303405 RepID=A0A9K3L0Q3_9STRA|nr:glycosyl transferase family protein [Nitzschia inconspicua]